MERFRFYAPERAWISNPLCAGIVPQALNGQVLLREAGAMLGIPHPPALH